MDVDKAHKIISFAIARGSEVKDITGTKAQRGPAKCPFCLGTTSEEDLRRAAIDGNMHERMIAVVVEDQGNKNYRPVEDSDLKAFADACTIPADRPSEYVVPEITGPASDENSGGHASIRVQLYGFVHWGQLFNHRQVLVLQTLIAELREALASMDSAIADRGYREALSVYLTLKRE
jgi:putative DNA methylase